MASLPEDPFTVSGEWGDTLEVGAGGDLEMVGSSCVSAVNDLSVNPDDGAPSGGQGILIGIAGEIDLA